MTDPYTPREIPPQQPEVPPRRDPGEPGPGVNPTPDDPNPAVPKPNLPRPIDPEHPFPSYEDVPPVNPTDLLHREDQHA